MTQNTNLKTLDFVQNSGAALEQAQKFAEAVNSEKQAAIKIASEVVDALVANRLIEDHERDSAFRKLASHDGALEVTQNLVRHLSETKQAAAKQAGLNQGGSVEKTASDHLTSSGEDREQHFAVGARAGLGEKRASDTAMRRLAGLPT